jgi:Zn-finger protein
MGRYDVRPCPCGSGKDSRWQYDARGIELCRTCSVCHKKKMAGYRQDVLTNSNYECDEAIEPEDY